MVATSITPVGTTCREVSATVVRLSDVSTSVTASSWRTEAYRRLNARLSEVLGDKTAAEFAKLKVATVGDLLLHLPRRYFSGTELSDLSQLEVGEEVAVLAEVKSSRAFNVPGRKPRLEAVITDHRGTVTLAFFGKPHMIDYWHAQLKPGSRGIFAGKVGEFRSELQLAHPDFVLVDEAGQMTGGAKRNEVLTRVTQVPLIGIYAATRKLPTWTITECVGLALEHLGEITDPLPPALREAVGVVELGSAYRGIHQPQQRDEIGPARDRLRFDEAFAIGLTMAARKADAVAHGAVARQPRRDGILDAFDARLPFTLTEGQQEVSAQIFADLAQPHPMQRLLQGEVGSGKTVVALRAMLAVVDAGGQAAFLAPTEVLATQHFHTITRMLGELGEAGTLAAAEHATRITLLTGSMGAVRRRTALLAAASGEAGIVIGTHALLGDQVQFADLGLIVVDEQHRFGVEQRAALSAKASSRPHVLVMTATPIPRSVAMTVFGDLEVSTLRQSPAGRADVQTVVVDGRAHPSWVARAWTLITEQVAEGRQAYVVCPRISESDKSAESTGDAPVGDEAPPSATVEDLYAELSAGALGELRVETLHGQLPSEDKEARMAAFAAGEVDVLIATTVIEVGVDVPNASVMVICDADRFGISQLHQLRGRIGRGGHPGTCLLLTAAAADTLARERLAAVAETRDGFRLADIDLEQRREGDVLGASQSGFRSSLQLLRVLTDGDLIIEARQWADGCIRDDPGLGEPGLADIVATIERRAAADWLERS